ncbi:hypothetical protein B0H19DRAFT_1055673 [Mycena capillaripes]|nr:hypothetical protein B0H19DRAFT_1055673 [Mycena capillaripes]
MFSTAQQLRDAHATIESLRNQITIMQSHTHNVERARDRAEMKLKVVEAREVRLGGPLKHEQRYKDHPDVVRVGNKIRCEKIYPEGGKCTYWITDESGDESDKENHIPTSSSSAPSFYLSSPSPLTLQPVPSAITSLSNAVAGPSNTITGPSTAANGMDAQ